MFQSLGDVFDLMKSCDIPMDPNRNPSMVLQFCRRPSGRVLGEMGQKWHLEGDLMDIDFIFHDSMTVWICEFSNFTYFDGDFDGLLQGPNWVPTGSLRGP